MMPAVTRNTWKSSLIHINPIRHLSPDLLVVRIDIGGAAVAVPGTVEVRQGLLQTPGAVPGHGAECDQAVTPGDENTRPGRYGAGVAATCDMKYRVFIFNSVLSQKVP